MAATLNYPFIGQFFLPKKGQPFSNSRQFGIQSLWRRYRFKHTPTSLKLLLSSPLFQSRVQTWSIQDLGSNTQQRFIQSKFIRSLAFSLSGCYALRKLAIHLTEPHHTLAITAIGSAIRFRQGKPAGRSFPFRAPWLLTSHLDKHLRRMLLTWFFHVRHTQTAFHEPSFKIIYVKHPALQDALCNHKATIQDWSDGVQPKCTCDLLRKYPRARSPMNKAEDHWVLRGSLLGTYLTSSQATLVSGSLHNKIFPNRSSMASQFTEAFHQWCKRSSVPMPSDHWIKQRFDPLWQDHRNRITSHLTLCPGERQIL